MITKLINHCSYEASHKIIVAQVTGGNVRIDLKIDDAHFPAHIGIEIE